LTKSNLLSAGAESIENKGIQGIAGSYLACNNTSGKNYFLIFWNGATFQAALFVYVLVKLNHYSA